MKRLRVSNGYLKRKKLKKFLAVLKRKRRFRFELPEEMKDLTKLTNHWDDHPCDKTSLEKLIKGELREGIKVLEIGAWLGRTTMLFMELIRGVGTLYVVDNWHGTDFWGEPWTRNESYKNFDYFYTFCVNIKENGIYDDVKILNMSSSQASELIKDEFFDVIFLDADYRYRSVKSDIINWYPKLKSGGLFIGHDCEIVFSDLDKDIQEIMLDPKNEDVDFLRIPHSNFNSHPGLHPGIIRAVHKLFEDHVATNRNSSIWSVRKETNT